MFRVYEVYIHVQGISGPVTTRMRALRTLHRYYYLYIMRGPKEFYHKGRQKTWFNTYMPRVHSSLSILYYFPHYRLPLWILTDTPRTLVFIIHPSSDPLALLLFTRDLSSVIKSISPCVILSEFLVLDASPRFERVRDKGGRGRNKYAG